MQKRQYIRTIALAVSVILLTTTLAGCGLSFVPVTDTTTAETKAAAELTDRQKEILKAAGLSTEYEELTDVQKESIVDIERALEYLEKTYGKEFVYTAYQLPDLLDGGRTVKCYEADDPDERPITVTIGYNNESKQYTFTDDYDMVLASRLHEQALYDYFCRETEATPSAVVSTVFEINGDVAADTVIRNTGAFTNVLFSASATDEKKLRELANDYARWVTEDQTGGWGDTAFMIVSDEAAGELSGLNYEDVLHAYGYTAYIMVSIASNGHVDIKEQNK